MTRIRCFVVLLTVVISACADKQVAERPAPEGARGTTPRDARPGPEPRRPPPTPEPAPRVDEAPAMELAANRHLFHLRRGGLVIPFSGEGFRKYVQEYRSPWGEVATADGKTGRVLASRAAVLNVPWFDEATEATLVVRARGAHNGQRVTVEVNGKRVINTGMEAGWQTLTGELSPTVLRKGENRVVVHVARSGAWFHSLEIRPGAPPAEDEIWPEGGPVRDLSVGGKTRQALTGFDAIIWILEVPPESYLKVATGSEGEPVRFRVRATDAGGKETTLLEERQEPGAWRTRYLSLAPLAGKLVALELAIVEGHRDRAGFADGAVVLAAAEQRKRPAPAKNAILWVGDALRSDALALYGKTRIATPRFTEMGQASGVVFLYNQAASPSSPPSHASIQTGMIPRVHGVVGDSAQLNPGTPMISTHLEDAGVATAYYGNNPFGMARLKGPGKWTAFHQPGQEGKGIDCTALVKEMLGFAAEQVKKGKRFFISSLAYEPHAPYRYHEGITDKYYKGPWDPQIGKSPDGTVFEKIMKGTIQMTDEKWAQLKALYDGEVEYMDACFGTLVDGLEEMGVLRDTALILTADHGEGFGEHGRLGHAYGHWFEVGDVPFVLWWPGLVQEGITVPVPTSHLDIAPTILDVMGVEPSPKIQGQSVVPLALRKGPWVPRVVSLEYGRSYALRAAHYRYIVDYQGKEMLYDSRLDPREQNDVIGKNALATRYFRDLAGFFLVHRSSWRTPVHGTLNNHTAAFPPR